MPASDLSGSRAGYVNKFHPVDLPQQNSKNQNARNKVGTQQGVVEDYWNFKINIETNPLIHPKHKTEKEKKLH